MSHAANRDREACQKLKERVHGEEEGRPDDTARMLMGHAYHVALFKKCKGGIDPVESASDIQLPEPLAMSKDEKKVGLLRKAFEHLGTLSFNDTPDYSLIKECLEGFLEEGEIQQNVAEVDWKQLAQSSQNKRKENPVLGKGVPNWDLNGEIDPSTGADFAEAEAISSSELTEENLNGLNGKSGDFARLPLELRYRIAQMEYNVLHHATIPIHLALRDWLRVVLPLLYGKWDSTKFEKGGHRSSDDGYRREIFLKLIEKCLKCARKFSNFRQLDCVYHCEQYGSASPKKKRKITSTISEPSSGSLGTDLIAISQVSFRLRLEKKMEEKKIYAPPPRLQFGSSTLR
jgi:hypothetical protein